MLTCAPLWLPCLTGFNTLSLKGEPTSVLDRGSSSVWPGNNDDAIVDFDSVDIVLFFSRQQ